MARNLSRCALNQATVDHADLRTAVDAAVTAGIPSIGLWRRQVDDVGVATARQMIIDAGLRVSSLCRGGFFTQLTDAAWRRAIDDNRRAIAVAAELGAPELVLVPGGISDRDAGLAGARRRVQSSIEALADDAAQANVRLALEPMHPMYAADRGVVSTIADALDLVADFPVEAVGIVIDSYHVWWDPLLESSLIRADAEERLALVQVADWLGVLRGDTLRSRGMPGSGSIDFRSFARLIAATSYRGDVECEVFNTEVWDRDPFEVSAAVAEAHDHLLAPWMSDPTGLADRERW